MNLWINGKAVDLKSASFQTVINSGLFSDEPLVGNYTYPFTVPFSDINEEIFKFSHLPEVRVGQVPQFDFLLEDGVYIVSGQGILLDSSRKTGYKISLISGASTIVNTLKSTKMTDINMGSAIKIFPSFSDDDVVELNGKPYILFTQKTGVDAPSNYDFLVLHIVIYDTSNITNEYSISYGVKWNTDLATTLADLAYRVNNPFPVPNWDSTTNYIGDSDGVSLRPDPMNDVSFVKYAGEVWFAGEDNVNQVPGAGPWAIIYASNGYQIDWNSLQYRYNTYRFDNPWDDKRFYAVVVGETIKIFYMGSGNWNFYPAAQGDVGSRVKGFNFTVAGEYTLDQSSESSESLFYTDEIGIYSGGSVGIGIIPDNILKLAANEGFEKHDFACFTVKNEGLKLWETGYSGFVNFFADNNFQINTYAQSDGLKQAFSPFPYLMKVLQYIFRQFQWNTSPSNVFQDEFLKKVCIYNNKVLESLLDQELTDPVTAYNDFYLKDHLPNISVYDLLAVFKKYYFGAIFYNPDIDNQPIICTYDSVIEDNEYFDDWTDIIVSLDFIKPPKFDGATFSYTQDTSDQYLSDNVKSLGQYDVKEPVATLPDLPSTDRNKSVRYVASEDSYFVRINNVWQFLSLNILPFVVGSGARKNTPKADTTAMFTGEVGDRTVTLPVVNQEGYSEKLFKTDVISSLRFLQYNGMQLPDSGSIFPTASNEGLLWHGNNGIVNTRATKMNNFLDQTQYAQATLNMDTFRAKLIRTNKKVRIDGCAYLLDYITLQNPMPSLAKAFIYLAP